MRAICVQDAIARLQKKLDHLDLGIVSVNSNYEPDKELSPQDISVFQLLWLLYDIQEWYYIRLDIETITKDDPLTYIIFVEGDESENMTYTFYFTYTDTREREYDCTFDCNFKDLTGLNEIFSELTVDAIIRLGRIKCPFRFHFVL